MNIKNILNVSVTCPKPEFINEANFLRIPVNDGHSAKILPFFELAYKFIGSIFFFD
jgi:dual specificity MAP kinase phosphatase